MKSLFGTLSLLWALSLGYSSMAEAAKACPEVVAGKSIGPLKIGMKKAAVGRLKLPKDLYEVYYKFQTQIVNGVALRLDKARCFTFEGKKYTDLKKGAKALAMKLGRCGPVEMRTGGNNIICHQRKIALLWNRGFFSLRVVTPDQWSKERVATLCDAYIGHGEIWTRAGKKRTLKVKGGERICFGSYVVTSAWKPDTIWAIPARSCGEKKKGKATLLNCDGWGLEFQFQGTLKSIRAYAPTRY